MMIAEKGDKIAGFLFEPIQGEAGVSSFFFLAIIIILEDESHWFWFGYRLLFLLRVI